MVRTLPGGGPELQAFAQRRQNRGVRLVGIVYSDGESEAAAFRDRYQLTYPQALDPGGRSAIDFGVFGVPETYVIAGDGTVMAKLLGAVDAATPSRGSPEPGQPHLRRAPGRRG